MATFAPLHAACPLITSVDRYAKGVVAGRLDACRIFVPSGKHGSSHCSPVETKAGDNEEYHWAGNASGFVIRVKDGPAIFHTGDTDLLGDIRYVSSHGPIDVMLACIGDHFTMGPERAAEAAKLVDPRLVVPMHYGTFLPVMTGTPELFARALEVRGVGERFRQLNVNEPAIF